MRKLPKGRGRLATPRLIQEKNTTCKMANGGSNKWNVVLESQMVQERNLNITYII